MNFITNRMPSSSSSRSSSNSNSINNPHNAAEELEAHIKDCASLLKCINTTAAVESIKTISPRGRTVTACVPWYINKGKENKIKEEEEEEEIRSVQVRFNYNEAFTCCDPDGNESKSFESLLSLLLANRCGVPDDT